MNLGKDVIDYETKNRFVIIKKYFLPAIRSALINEAAYTPK